MAETGIDAKLPSTQPPKKVGDGVIKITEADLSTPVKSDIVITDTDLTPEIQITAADLPVEPPIVQINRRDLARNRLEWLGGAARDLITKGKQLLESKGWWGKGKSAERKIAAYQQSEQKIDSYEDLFDRIKIFPDNLNERLSDREVSEIEVKILQGKLKTVPSEPEIQINISEEQLQQLLSARQEALATQRQLLSEVYANNVQFNTPLVM